MINALFYQDKWIASSHRIVENTIFVKFVIDGRYKFSCPHCNCRIIKHSNRIINVQDLPIVDKRVFLEIPVVQGYCKNCQKYCTIRPSWCHPSLGYTWRFMKRISEHLKSDTARHIGEIYGVSYSSVIRIDKEVLKSLTPKPKLDNVRGVLIDEKYLGASKGFVTIVLDAMTGEPLELTPGRNGTNLNDFFNRFTPEQKENIKYLGIDRANTYRIAVQKHIPSIIVCYDAFHLVSNMNDVLDKIRRNSMKHATYGFESFMKGKRYLLLKGIEKLDLDAKLKLRELQTINEALYKAYLLKEQFRQVFRAPDANIAMSRLSTWIQMCMKSDIKELQRFAKGIASKFNEIINGIRYRINSAKIESANAAIKRLITKSCGIFDEEYLFLKLRQIYLDKQSKLPRRILFPTQQI